MNSDFFYQCLPNKTYQVKSEKCYGGKLSKTRIIDMAVVNSMDDKLPMFIIGKAKNLQCFKNVKFLRCPYRNQRKIWMDGKLFEKWLRKLDREFAFEGRNFAFVIDNCPAHPHIDNLEAIKLYFLLPLYYFQDPTNRSRCHRLLESKIPEEYCPENYSDCRKEENPFENLVAAKNANVSRDLGCTIEANNRELLSKV